MGLKKNRIAAQRSYKKRVENTHKLEKQNQDLHERVLQTAAALELAQEQWRRYAELVASHGLQSAVEQAEGLLPPPQSSAKKTSALESPEDADDVQQAAVKHGVAPLESFSTSFSLEVQA